MKGYSNEYFDESNLVSYFLKIKAEYKRYSEVFLSERFWDLYNILLNKYPEIKLPKSSLYKGSFSKTFCKSILINDINIDLPHELAIFDACFVYMRVKNFIDSYVYRIPEATSDDFEVSTNTSKYIPKDYDMVSKYSIIYPEDAINFLAKETNYLSSNGITDAFELLPEFLQKYFKYCNKYEKEINYFYTAYKNRYVEHKSKNIIDIDIVKVISGILKEMSLNPDFNVDDDFLYVFDYLVPTSPFDSLNHEYPKRETNIKRKENRIRR